MFLATVGIQTPSARSTGKQPAKYEQRFNHSLRLSRYRRAMHARIVIVDDRSTNLRVYAQYVAMMGPEFSAKCFHSAIDALQWLETEPADLLVVDYRMPDMNGAEFISKIR